MAKILVTGAGGYIGTQLVRDLVANNNEVVALDRYFFGSEPMKEFVGNPRVQILKRDIRDLAEKDFSNIDVVCDLACLSNDPAGEIDPELTYQINRDGRIQVAKLAKKAGVKKYIISSSCSVYGQGGESELKEDSPTNPLSVYAKSTLQAEQENLALSDKNFSVTSLRNATVFGLSTRMRFDLVVNLMTLTAFQKGRIIVMGGGNQWRPLVHVSDVSQAFNSVIHSKVELVNQEVFNVGISNYRVLEVAHLVRKTIANDINIDVAPDDIDKRDYKVEFAKLKSVLNYKPQKSVEYGIFEIYEKLKEGRVDFGKKSITVEWYKHLIEMNKVLNDIVINGKLL